MHEELAAVPIREPLEGPLVSGAKCRKWTHWPEYGPMPEATNISQESSSPRSLGVSGGRNLPVFSAR